MSIKNFFIGKKALQPLFEKMHRVSLRGMNYGMGGFTETSGEKYLVDHLNHLFKDQKITILDIGASCGDYSNKILRQVRIPFELHTIEAGAIAFEELKKGIISPKAKLHNIGISDYTGKGQLYFDTAGSAGASLNQLNYDLEKIYYSRSEEIEVTTLDDFCQKNEILHIHLCKMDVEGHELNILKGAKNLLQNHQIDIIQFEIGPSNTSSGRFLRDFFTILDQFTIYRLLQNGIQKIDYNERYEIFLTSNYVAISNHSNIKW